MKKILILTIVFSILLHTLFPLSMSTVQASEACPESMQIQERYLCLQKELEKLESNQGALEKRLKDEDYQQLSLKEKISYITNQISQTEDIVNTLHIEITAQDLEINMLDKEIQEKEDDLSLLRQEINILEQTVNERVTESYKFSYVSAFELFLDIKNFDEVLRKTKYLIETRARDKSSLAEYGEKTSDLENDEILLAEKKAELQKKRNEIEDEKVRLLEEKKLLDSQRVEKDKLLAESQRREEEYRKQLAETTAAISSIDEKISDVVIELFNTGQLGSGMRVVAGQTIGFQGHTGCSFGSHLHFDIRNQYDVRQDPANYLVGGTVWSAVLSKVYLTPMEGAMLTQSYKSTHRAWDMVSLKYGIQDGSTYTVPSGICSIVDYYIRVYNRDWAYLTGEGAPVRAISNGKVYYGTIIPDGPNGSKYPAKYALVVHDDGNKSFYLHLK